MDADCFKDISNLFMEPQYADVVIYCKNGKIFSHQLVLASCSIFLRNILKEQLHHDCDPISLFLPDFTKQCVSLLMLILQRGEAIAEKMELHSLSELMSLLQIYVDVTINRIAPQAIKYEHGKLQNIEAVPELYDCGTLILEEGAQIQSPVATKDMPQSPPLKKNTNKPVYKYSCRYCAKLLSQKGSLRKHEQIHTGIKPFSCSFCSKPFRTKFHLQTHELIHTGLKPFKCTACLNQYRTKYELKCHFKTHTNRKDYQCEICAKFFTTRMKLLQHKKIHSIVRPFQCHMCGKSYPRLQYLKTHIKTYNHDISSITCTAPNCGRSFLQLNHFKAHVKSHSTYLVPVDKPVVQDIEVCNLEDSVSE